MNHIPVIDVEHVSAAYEARVRAALRGEFPAALHLCDRLDPARWALEWSLPLWLADALNVDSEVALEICLSNVLGLASIRLADDVEDGELPDTVGTLPASEVSERLYEEALAVYRRLFDQGSEFWAQLALRMSEWRFATSRDGAESRLAMRGAPLKICAFAICLLSGRQQEFAALARCLDHALCGMVLYDSVIDWREDVAGDRWNPFVEAALARAASVEVAMLTSDVVAAHFGEIVAELERGATVASKLGIRDLHSYLTQLALQLHQEGADLESRYQEFGAKAQLLLFGNQPRLAA